VTDKRFGALVRAQVPEVGMLVEPTGKNTAASIALATVSIQRPDDEVMLVLPADQTVERDEDFVRLLATAERLASTPVDPLVALGVRPESPATDRAWLRPDTSRQERFEGVRTWPLFAVEDSPGETRARDLMNLPGVSWSSGIFAWRRSAIRAAIEKYTPLMTMIGTATGSDIALRAAYERLMPMSIAKAVLEGAAADHRVVMASMNVGWTDLDSWPELLRALAPDRIDGASGRVVQTGELLTPGPEDLVVRRDAAGLTVEAVPEGTIVADAELAHLTRARHLNAEVQALIDRVRRQERAA
jgi:mannose-1-phosphate guanylyltransferase